MLAAAEQLVHRDAVHLAFQIPEGRFDAVDNGHPESNPTPVVSGLIHPPPELGDVLDTLANEDGREEVDDRWHSLRDEIAGVRFADADELRVGQDLDVGRAAPLATLAQVGIVRGRAGQQDRLDTRDLHAGGTPVGR